MGHMPGVLFWRPDEQPNEELMCKWRSGSRLTSETG